MLTKNEQSELLIKFANPVNFIDLCLSDRIFEFHFQDFGDEGFARTVADIVRFLISYNPESDKFRHQASIKKAHFFLLHHSWIGINQSLSWRRFSTIWGEFKAVATFIYVNEYHFKGQLIFDPTSPEFLTASNGCLAIKPDWSAFLDKVFSSGTSLSGAWIKGHGTSRIFHAFHLI